MADAPTTDVIVWNAIEDSQDPADFETFLEAYPNSPLAPFARNRAKSLRAGATANLPQPSESTARASEPGAEAPTLTEPEPATPAPDPAAIEAALDLSHEQIQEIQVALTALGHDTRGADGILGRNSRTALSSWQQAGGELATGYLTAAQRVALLDSAKSALAESRQRPGPGTEFRDCRNCPLMVALPAGSFMMGSTEAERQWALEQGAKPQRVEPENPQHFVRIAEPFAVGKYEVTFEEWDACVTAGGCSGYAPNDEEWGRSRRPVINVSWDDARSYAAWLTKQTDKPYRLLSEAEWEYAARAQSTTRYSWGHDITSGNANYRNNVGRTIEVGSFPSNLWGLHDMQGNVWEWVEDCWNESYRGAPNKGDAWTSGDCSRRVLRGGSWDNPPGNLRSASRFKYGPAVRFSDFGFRVARMLSQGESVTP